nr:LuxR C-terminal-related transcriptional regulator [Streptomyces sp. SID13031]
MCGNALPPARQNGPRAGRPARYCSNACRQRAFRHRTGTRDRIGRWDADAVDEPGDRFVGRRRELTLLNRQLRASRLVTLTGPAGVGKTRTAREFVGSLGTVPFYLVPLDSVSQPAQVLAAVAAAIGVDGRRQAMLDAVVEQLAVNRSLLVLDNCEHLPEACAELIERLLGRCPRLRVLTTSREPLRARGEVVVRLGVLSLPKSGQALGKEKVLATEAAKLFVDRALAVDPGFAVTEENAALVAQICCRVDGLPLAIELAARRVSAVPLAEVLAGLTDQLGLLTDGIRTGPPRHRELRAAIAWSYRLLTAGERLVFRRICVLESDFDVPAAADVVGVEAASLATTQRVLWSLEAKSLIQRVLPAEPDEPRFRLLNTVRNYGLERLAADAELMAARDRLAERLARIAGPAVSSFFFGGSASVEVLRERDNLVAAAEHTAHSADERHTVLAVALARMSWHLQQTSAGTDLLRRAIALDPDRRTAHHCDLLSTLAWLTALNRDYTEAFRLAIEAVGLAARRDVPAQLTRALDVLGRIHLFRDEFGQAVEAYRGCVRHAPAEDRPMCLRNLAWALVLAGEVGEAATLMTQTSSEDPVVSLRMRGALMHTSGLLQLAEGDIAAAEKTFAAALKATAAHSYYAAYSIEAMALVAARQDDNYRASILFAGAAATRETLGLDAEPAWQRQLDAATGRVLVALGHPRAGASVAYGNDLKLDQLVAYALRRYREDDVPAAAGEPTDHPLTDRELQVVALVAAGLTNPQIAGRLHISASTVKTHLAGIRNKLELRSRTQIAVWYTAVRQVS